MHKKSAKTLQSWRFSIKPVGVYLMLSNTSLFTLTLYFLCRFPTTVSQEILVVGSNKATGFGNSFLAVGVLLYLCVQCLPIFQHQYQLKVGRQPQGAFVNLPSFSPLPKVPSFQFANQAAMLCLSLSVFARWLGFFLAFFLHVFCENLALHLFFKTFPF